MKGLPVSRTTELQAFHRTWSVGLQISKVAPAADPGCRGGVIGQFDG